MYERLQGAILDVKKHVDFTPEVALVLGSGLGDFVEKMTVHSYLGYDKIAGFPQSTVPGHAGRFVFGEIEGVKVVAMQGRVHYYEGYSIEDVVLPVRLMGMMGAKILFLTNAAGGVNCNFSMGTLMAISDHIMLTPNPLIGKNIDELGTRFPDMTACYDRELIDIMTDTSRKLGIDLCRGVYLQTSGPSYETPAEIRMMRVMGADAVGMSTACEATAAHHMGLRVCGISCITNMASGITAAKLSHDDVKQTAEYVKDKFSMLVTNIIKNFKEVL